MKKIFSQISKPSDRSIIVKEEIAEQFAAPFHFHKQFEITYIVKGRGKFYGGNRLLNFHDDEMYIFGPHFPHKFVNEKAFVDNHETGHSIIIQFTENSFNRNFIFMPEFKSIKPILKTSKWGIKIAHPCQKLRQHCINITEANGLSRIIIFLQILDIISQIPKCEITVVSSDVLKNLAPGSMDKRLEPVFQYVLENFKNTIKVQTVASLVFMNESAFCRYFKRRTGKTLSQFVNEVRITHATYLLSEKDLNISEICYGCGFNNLSYFNRQFKTIMGISPFHYRKKECFSH